MAARKPESGRQRRLGDARRNHREVWPAVACQGDGSVHVIDIPTRRAKQSFRAGTGCESLGFF
jgi:hypothetical protein